MSEPIELSKEQINGAWWGTIAFGEGESGFEESCYFETEAEVDQWILHHQTLEAKDAEIKDLKQLITKLVELAKEHRECPLNNTEDVVIIDNLLQQAQRGD